MTRLADMQAAALHLDRLPPGTYVRIGNDGEGPEPVGIRCQIVMPDGVTVGSATGDAWEEVARAVADAMSCPPVNAVWPSGEIERVAANLWHQHVENHGGDPNACSWERQSELFRDGYRDKACQALFAVTPYFVQAKGTVCRICDGLGPIPSHKPPGCCPGCGRLSEPPAGQRERVAEANWQSCKHGSCRRNNQCIYGVIVCQKQSTPPSHGGDAAAEVVVPARPTEAMRRAGGTAIHPFSWDFADEVWRRMVEAAPARAALSRPGVGDGA